MQASCTELRNTLRLTPGRTSAPLERVHQVGGMLVMIKKMLIGNENWSWTAPQCERNYSYRSVLRSTIAGKD